MLRSIEEHAERLILTTRQQHLPRFHRAATSRTRVAGNSKVLSCISRSDWDWPACLGCADASGFVLLLWV